MRTLKMERKLLVEISNRASALFKQLDLRLVQPKSTNELVVNGAGTISDRYKYDPSSLKMNLALRKQITAKERVNEHDKKYRIMRTYLDDLNVELGFIITSKTKTVNRDLEYEDSSSRINTHGVALAGIIAVYVDEESLLVKHVNLLFSSLTTDELIEFLGSDYRDIVDINTLVEAAAKSCGLKDNDWTLETTSIVEIPLESYDFCLQFAPYYNQDYLLKEDNIFTICDSTKTSLLSDNGKDFTKVLYNLYKHNKDLQKADRAKRINKPTTKQGLVNMFAEMFKEDGYLDKDPLALLGEVVAKRIKNNIALLITTSGQKYNHEARQYETVGEYCMFVFKPKEIMVAKFVLGSFVLLRLNSHEERAIKNCFINLDLSDEIFDGTRFSYLRDIWNNKDLELNNIAILCALYKYVSLEQLVKTPIVQKLFLFMKDKHTFDEYFYPSDLFMYIHDSVYIEPKCFLYEATRYGRVKTGSLKETTVFGSYNGLGSKIVHDIISNVLDGQYEHGPVFGPLVAIESIREEIVQEYLKKADYKKAIGLLDKIATLKVATICYEATRPYTSRNVSRLILNLIETLRDKWTYQEVRTILKFAVKACLEHREKMLLPGQHDALPPVLDLWLDMLQMTKTINFRVEAYGLKDEFPMIEGSNIVFDYSANIDRAVKFAHDRLTAYSNEIAAIVALRNQELDKERQIKQDNAFKELGKKWKQYEFSDDLYSIVIPKCTMDVIVEGIKLSHCVGSYVDNIADDNTTILFIRENDNLDEPFFTMEVTNGSIRQVHGYKNKNVPKNSALAEFINKFTDHLKLKKGNINSTLPVGM